MEQQQIQKIIDMYSKRRPLKAIGRETGIAPKQIKKWLIQQKLWTGHRFLPLYFDEFFFDNIDTEEKAYWLGFFFADGYLTQSSNNLGIELKATEIKHLEKFRQTLQAEHTVKVYHKNSTFGPQDNCRFVIGSKHMKAILLSYFGTVDKTHNGHLPKLENPQLIRHLIRGFFDGDGSISLGSRPGGLVPFGLSFTGRKEVLEYIEEVSGFIWSWSQRFPESGVDNYQISCGRVNDAINFLKYMYEDSTIYLDRKKERCDFILQNRAEFSAKARV